MNIVVKRYAKALLESIPDDKKEAVLKEYENLLSLFNKRKEIYFIFKNQAIDKRRKKEIVEEGFSFETGDYLKNLLNLLIEKERIAEVEDIYKEAFSLYLEEQGVEKVVLEVAKPLSQEEKKELKSLLEKKLKTKILLEEKVNPSIIGGIKLHYQDMILDATLSGKIQKIYQKIIEE